MNTVHKMRINWPDGYDKDECIQQLVENILARFPDAEVLSAPVDVGEENIDGHDHRWIEQSFTSKFFDYVSNSVIGMIIDELFDMRDSLNDEDSLIKGEHVDYISSVMNAIIDHLSHKFLGDDCDYA